MTKPVVLVTGVAGAWGGRVAAKLLSRDDLTLIGVDSQPPENDDLKGLDFIRADLNSPLLPDLLKEENVHTVVHLDFIESVRPSERSFEHNTMGTMRLLGACVSAGVSKVIWRSSIMVYGARATNSAFLSEDTPLQASRRYGYLRDWLEIESFCNGFRRQNPQTALTILRFAHIVGPNIQSPLTRFLQNPAMPSLLGFDPRMQVIHEHDVTHALVHAIDAPATGVFNVAAEGVFPLWKVSTLAGKLPVPVLHPLAYWGAAVGGEQFAPMDLDYLRYHCVGDLTRMRTVLEFTPTYTAEETLREFATQQRLRRYWPGAAERDEEQLRDTLERRRRSRARRAAEEERHE